ncbi:hypothetical protein HDU81_005489 [Chytriomyces hyalinus]|nr:hypothetical protein HDU81_005489 [Chytriomyces hyalinus]
MDALQPSSEQGTAGTLIVPKRKSALPAPVVLASSNSPTFEDCLKQLSQFNSQLQNQQLQLKQLQSSVSKYVERVRTAVGSSTRGSLESDGDGGPGPDHMMHRNSSKISDVAGEIYLAESIGSAVQKYRAARINNDSLESSGRQASSDNDGFSNPKSGRSLGRDLESTNKLDKRRRSSLAASGIVLEIDFSGADVVKTPEGGNGFGPMQGSRRSSGVAAKHNLGLAINMPDDTNFAELPPTSRRRSSPLASSFSHMFKPAIIHSTSLRETSHDNVESSVLVDQGPNPQQGPATFSKSFTAPLNVPTPPAPTIADSKQEKPTVEKPLPMRKSLLHRICVWLFVDAMFQELGENNSKSSSAGRGNAGDKNPVDSARIVGININSRFNVVWEFIMSGVYLFVLIKIPMITSFSHELSVSADVSTGLTAVFAVATFLNFFTAPGTNLRHRITRYLTKGFFADLIGTIPFDMILADHIPFSETLLLLRLVHVRNVVRIYNTNPIYVAGSHILQKMFKVGSSFMSIFMLGGVLITFLHLHGCFIFLFGKLTHFEAASWVAIHHILDASLADQYIWAYFAAVANTFPITGYQPSDPYEQLVAIITALIGAVLYAILVGTISSFSFGLDSSGRRYKEKIDEVHEYMTYRKLSEPIKMKVRQYYELKYKGKYFDEEAILSEMNESLKQEIAVHNCRDLIAKVPFLNRDVGDGRDAHFLGRIAKVLRPVYFIEGDLIFDQGWVGNEMYFIQQGCVAIIVNGNRVGELRDGAFFGEVALLGEIPRTATIVAAGNTVLYSFGRSDFSAILKDYEDMALRIKLVYEERMAKIEKEKDEKAKKEAGALDPNKH